MIVFENVVKTYETGTSALNGISFKINNGEFVFIEKESNKLKSLLKKQKDSYNLLK